MMRIIQLALWGLGRGMDTLSTLSCRSSRDDKVHYHPSTYYLADDEGEALEPGDIDG